MEIISGVPIFRIFTVTKINKVKPLCYKASTLEEAKMA